MDIFETYGHDLQILGYVALSMALGAVVGFEREVVDKPAGLRTHMLVAGATALLVALGGTIVDGFQEELGGNLVQADPIRIIEAVITGVSFLGAGTILRRRGKLEVEGLTTAASLLFVAALGVSVALSQGVLAVGATVLVLVTLRGLKLIEYWIDDRKNDETG